MAPPSRRFGPSAEAEHSMKKKKKWNLAMAAMIMGAALAASLLLVRGDVASSQADFRATNAPHSEVAETDLVA